MTAVCGRRPSHSPGKVWGCSADSSHGEAKEDAGEKWLLVITESMRQDADMIWSDLIWYDRIMIWYACFLFSGDWWWPQTPEMFKTKPEEFVQKTQGVDAGNPFFRSDVPRSWGLTTTIPAFQDATGLETPTCHTCLHWIYSWKAYNVSNFRLERPGISQSNSGKLLVYVSQFSHMLICFEVMPVQSFSPSKLDFLWSCFIWTTARTTRNKTMKIHNCPTRRILAPFSECSLPQNPCRLNVDKSMSRGFGGFSSAWIFDEHETHLWQVPDLWESTDQVLPSEGPAEKLDQLKLWVKQEGSLTLPLPFLRLLLAKMKIDLDACLPMILCWDVFKKETRNGDDVLRFDLPRAGALLKKKHEKK